MEVRSAHLDRSSHEQHPTGRNRRLWTAPDRELRRLQFAHGAPMAAEINATGCTAQRPDRCPSVLCRGCLPSTGST